MSRQCRFDPASLACSGAKTDACLSPQQSNAWQRPSPGPGTHAAPRSYPAFPWDSGIAAASVPIPGILTTGARSPVGPPFHETINVDADRGRMNADGMERLQSTANWTNLNSFFGHGGKILFYHGVSDPWFSALDTIDYYERMARAPAAWTRCARTRAGCISSPGMGHCGSGRNARAIRPAAGGRRLGRAGQGAGLRWSPRARLSRPQPAALRLSATCAIQRPGQSGRCGQLRMP